MSDLEILTGDQISEATSGDFNSFGTSAKLRKPIPQSVVESATRLLDKAFKGNRRARQEVREAFSTSDFTMAAFAIIDREVQALLVEQPANWKAYTSETTVNNFLPKTILDLTRNRIGLSKVAELAEYPAVDRSGFATYTIQVAKYGARFAASFEAWINDTAIDEIDNWPALFAQAAAETETLTAIANLCNAAGPNTDFFKLANGNAPDNAPLTLANLDAAIQEIQSRKSPEGYPVYTPSLRLVIPPALKTTADRILAAKEIRTTVGSTEIISDNYLAGSVQPVVEPWLEVVNQSAKAATTWYLLPDPATARKSLWLARLRGHETPDIRYKSDQGNRVGGGAIAFEDGSFECDDLQVRVRHIVGGATGDPLPTYVSEGS